MFVDSSLSILKSSGTFQVGKVSSIKNFCLFNISKYHFHNKSVLISLTNYLL